MASSLIWSSRASRSCLSAMLSAPASSAETAFSTACEHLVGVVEEDGEFGRRLGGGAGEFALRAAQLGDERLGGLQALRDHLFGRLHRAAGDQLDGVLGGLRLDHHDRDVALPAVRGVQHAAGDDHVEGRSGQLGVGRERDPLTVDQGDPGAADRAGERQAGDLGRRRCGIDRKHVVGMRRVQRKDGDDDLYFVAQALDEGRPQRAVDQPAGEDGVLARTSLAPEERSGDSTRGVHPLFHVDGQREEVEPFARVLARSGGRQQHGLVVEVRDDRTGGLLGQPSGLEADRASAELAVVD